MMRGDPNESGSRKASANRPQPWDPNANPLEEDRFRIGEEMARRRSEHASSHSRGALTMESFSHPACGALSLEERRDCPLLSVAWSRSREVPGGIELETFQRGVDASRLRWRFLCHLAYARTRGADDGCPLEVRGVGVSTVQAGQIVRVRIVSDDASQVSELRRRIKRLVP